MISHGRCRLRRGLAIVLQMRGKGLACSPKFYWTSSSGLSICPSSRISQLCSLSDVVTRAGLFFTRRSHRRTHPNTPLESTHCRARAPLPLPICLRDNFAKILRIVDRIRQLEEGIAGSSKQRGNRGQHLKPEDEVIVSTLRMNALCTELIKTGIPFIDCSRPANIIRFLVGGLCSHAVRCQNLMDMRVACTCRQR